MTKITIRIDKLIWKNCIGYNFPKIQLIQRFLYFETCYRVQPKFQKYSSGLKALTFSAGDVTNF